jgi:twitching motility protein PilI
MSRSPISQKIFLKAFVVCDRAPLIKQTIAIAMPQLMKAIDALNRQFELPVASVPASQPERRWRGLRVGNVGLLVPHDSGGELLEDAHVYPLPRAPAWCRGLINLRGQQIPVFDLHEYFNLSSYRAPKQWCLIIGRGADSVCFYIDALPRSVVVTDAARLQSAIIPVELRPFVNHVYRIADEFWLEFKDRDFFASLAGLRAA